MGADEYRILVAAASPPEPDGEVALLLRAIHLRSDARVVALWDVAESAKRLGAASSVVEVVVDDVRSWPPARMVSAFGPTVVGKTQGLELRRRLRRLGRVDAALVLDDAGRCRVERLPSRPAVVEVRRDPSGRFELVGTTTRRALSPLFDGSWFRHHGSGRHREEVRALAGVRGDRLVVGVGEDGRHDFADIAPDGRWWSGVGGAVGHHVLAAADVVVAPGREGIDPSLVLTALSGGALVVGSPAALAPFRAATGADPAVIAVGEPTIDALGAAVRRAAADDTDRAQRARSAYVRYDARWRAGDLVSALRGGEL